MSRPTPIDPVAVERAVLARALEQPGPDLAETRELRRKIWALSRRHLATRSRRSRTMAPASASLCELARAAADGDPEAWSELLDRLAGKLLRYARQHVSQADAEDLVQETWRVALSRPETFGQHPEPAGFLFRTLQYRMRERGRRQLRRETPIGEAPTPSQEEDETFARLLAQERQELLVEALAEACTPLEHDVVVLSSQGLPPKEIGPELGISAGHASVLKHRAIDKLRRHLEGRG